MEIIMMVEVWASTEFHLHDDEEQHRESGENGDLSVASSQKWPARFYKCSQCIRTEKISFAVLRGFFWSTIFFVGKRIITRQWRQQTEHLTLCDCVRQSFFPTRREEHTHTGGSTYGCPFNRSILLGRALQRWLIHLSLFGLQSLLPQSVGG